MNTETLLYKDWITYFEDDSLKIEFDAVPIIQDVEILPYMTKKERKAILKKPFKLQNGLWIKIEYKNNKTKNLVKNFYSLYIPSGYRWNGANVPFGLYNLIGSPSDPRFKIASMVHDFLCENRYFIGYNRYLSTKIFVSLLEEMNVSKFKRFLMFHSVDNYQKFQHWKKQTP